MQIQIPVNDFLFLKKLQIIKSGIKHYKLYNFVLQHRLLFPAGPVCWSPNVPPSRCLNLFDVISYDLVHIQIPVNYFLFLKKLQIIKSGLKHYKWYNSVLQRWLLFPAAPVCGSPNVPPSRLDTVQDFLNKLGMKPCINLVEISNFSLNHVTVRLTVIMNNLLEHLEILIFKVIFQGWKLVESFKKKICEEYWTRNQLLNKYLFENFDF